jgi:hypothetical protein
MALSLINYADNFNFTNCIYVDVPSDDYVDYMIFYIYHMDMVVPHYVCIDVLSNDCS